MIFIAGMGMFATALTSMQATFKFDAVALRCGAARARPSVPHHQPSVLTHRTRLVRLTLLTRLDCPALRSLRSLSCPPPPTTPTTTTTTTTTTTVALLAVASYEKGLEKLEDLREKIIDTLRGEDPDKKDWDVMFETVRSKPAPAPAPCMRPRARARARARARHLLFGKSYRW